MTADRIAAASRVGRACAIGALLLLPLSMLHVIAIHDVPRFFENCAWASLMLAIFVALDEDEHA